MPTIIKKGTNPSAFRLKNGKTINIEVGRGGGEMLNFVSEDDFKTLMQEYGCFISPRIISDSNPDGCFIIHADKKVVQDMSEEIGDEIQDNSGQIEVEAPADEEPLVLSEDPLLEEETEIGDEIQDVPEVEQPLEETPEPEKKSNKGKK